MVQYIFGKYHLIHNMQYFLYNAYVVTLHIVFYQLFIYFLLDVCQCLQRKRCMQAFFRVAR